MQLIIKDRKIIATHEDHQNIAALYPGCDCILWDKPLPHQGPEDSQLDDPRNAEDLKLAYKDKRRVAYPKIEDQLDMLYHDLKDGTTIWVDSITSVKEQYPISVSEEKL